LLTNLLSNAAVKHGGSNVSVTVGAIADGFYIKDDGPGIDADERKSVFEAGYSPSAEGTGFGLKYRQASNRGTRVEYLCDRRS